jgi:hypothetical protein
MPSSSVTELALRAAVNTNSRNLSESGGQADAIKGTAMQHAQGGLAGVSVSGAQAEAIAIAVAGVALAYTAISDQLGRLKNQRLDFDKEREAGIATFMIPNNREQRDLSNEEAVIKGFLDLTMRSSSFSKYLGIHSSDLSTDSSGKFYSVLPFYRMSEALGQPLASTRPLDRQRMAINLFFKSALPDAIADIDSSFQTDSKFVAFWVSAYKGKNYLNDRRAPRFIMMGLSNLLWNLQHPVDPDTGFPLSLNQCIEICRNVELSLNQLLNPASPPYLHTISNDENKLMSFMRKLEIYTKTLRAAYVEEQLHELNIDEITNSAHQTLRIMDKSVFELIYKRHNPLSKKDEPDEKAAETLAYMITYLNELLTENGDLIGKIQPIPEWIRPVAGMNNPPQTVIDVLILFCHLPRRELNHLLAQFEHSDIASEIEFAKTLEEFEQKFVKPIKDVSKVELDATAFSPKREEVGILTARRLVPFITLVVEDYRIEVDTPISYRNAKFSQENTADIKKIMSGKQQAEFINLSAQKGDEYYNWALSPFTEGTRELDNLPKYQYRMTQVTKLMDSVSELVKNYRSFLLEKSFQSFLIKCLSRIKAEYAILDRHIMDADNGLAHNERMSRSLQAILRPMTSDLNTSLDAFALATTNFERVVSAPDFTDQQRQLLSSKLGSIADQFLMLFRDDSGLAVFLDAPPITTGTDAPVRPTIAPTPTSVVHEPVQVVDAKQIFALRKLVQSCYDALSYQSREGRKGLLLRDLLLMIEGGSVTTEREVKHAVMELTRVAATQRETWFFQAAYGQTRSAKVLIAAIKDPSLNGVLPLASIIFGKSTTIQQLDEALILQRLTSLREGNQRWQVPSDEMRIAWPDRLVATEIPSLS